MTNVPIKHGMNFIHGEFDKLCMNFSSCTTYRACNKNPPKKTKKHLKNPPYSVFVVFFRILKKLLPRPDSTERPPGFVKKTLTLFDDEEAEGEDHGVAGEDVVPAVDVLPVDGQPHTRHQHEHALHYHWTQKKNKVFKTRQPSVADPWHFGVDPDPGIYASD